MTRLIHLVTTRSLEFVGHSALSLFLIVALAACTVDDGIAPPPETPQAATPTTMQTARVPAQPKPVPVINAPKPADIIGSPSSKLVAKLGSATLVRTDISAEIWQYRTEDCVLFLFLYPGESEMAVRHIDSRGGPSPESCIRSVVKAKLSGVTG